MNEKVQQLKDLDASIKKVIADNGEALGREFGLRSLIEDLSREASRRLDRVSEKAKSSTLDPIVDMEAGIKQFIAGTCGVLKHVTREIDAFLKK